MQGVLLGGGASGVATAGGAAASRGGAAASSAVGGTKRRRGGGAASASATSNAGNGLPADLPLTKRWAARLAEHAATANPLPTASSSYAAANGAPSSSIAGITGSNPMTSVDCDGAYVAKSAVADAPVVPFACLRIIADVRTAMEPNSALAELLASVRAQREAFAAQAGLPLDGSNGFTDDEGRWIASQLQLPEGLSEELRQHLLHGGPPPPPPPPPLSFSGLIKSQLSGGLAYQTAVAQAAATALCSLRDGLPGILISAADTQRAMLHSVYLPTIASEIAAIARHAALLAGLVEREPRLDRRISVAGGGASGSRKTGRKNSSAGGAGASSDGGDETVTVDTDDELDGGERTTGDGDRINCRAARRGRSASSAAAPAVSQASALARSDFVRDLLDALPELGGQQGDSSNNISSSSSSSSGGGGGGGGGGSDASVASALGGLKRLLLHKLTDIVESTLAIHAAAQQATAAEDGAAEGEDDSSAAAVASCSRSSSCGGRVSASAATGGASKRAKAADCGSQSRPQTQAAHPSYDSQQQQQQRLRNDDASAVADDYCDGDDNAAAVAEEDARGEDAHGEGDEDEDPFAAAEAAAIAHARRVLLETAKRNARMEWRRNAIIKRAAKQQK